LDATSKAHLVQLLCHGQGHLSLDQAADSKSEIRLDQGLFRPVSYLYKWLASKA